MHKGKSSVTGSNEQKRHDEHSVKSVRAKIAMFSTQKSSESSPSTAPSASNNNNSGTSLRSTPSPVGNSGRNSLSGQHILRTSTTTPPSSETTNAVLPSTSRPLTHGDDLQYNDLPSKVGILNPYHRSMINVSSSIPDVVGVPQQQRCIVPEKSQSHADLTKSNDLNGYKDQKPHLARVNSSETPGAEMILRNKNIRQYNQINPQHGRSQSLLEIGSNALLVEGSRKEIQNTSASGIFKSGNATKDNIGHKKIVSDRSQSSSALLVHSSIFDESKTTNTNPNLIHSRRRHTLTKLKGMIIGFCDSYK